MAYVILQDEIVSGLFTMPQPHLEGYAEIDDNDPRILEFLNNAHEKESE